MQHQGCILLHLFNIVNRPLSPIHVIMSLIGVSGAQLTHPVPSEVSKNTSDSPFYVSTENRGYQRELITTGVMPTIAD